MRTTMIVLTLLSYLLAACHALPQGPNNNTPIPCYPEASDAKEPTKTYPSVWDIEPSSLPDDGAHGWFMTKESCFVSLEKIIQSAPELASNRPERKIGPRRNPFSYITNYVLRLFGKYKLSELAQKVVDELKRRNLWLEGEKTLPDADVLAYDFELSCTDWFTRLVENFGVNISLEVARYLLGQRELGFVEEVYQGVHSGDIRDPETYDWETFAAEYLSEDALGKCNASKTVFELISMVERFRGGI